MTGQKIPVYRRRYPLGECDDCGRPLCSHEGQERCCDCEADRQAWARCGMAELEMGYGDVS